MSTEQAKITEYAAGFLFDPVMQRVALIRKARPTWQAGKLNAIGGHVEAGETTCETMVREFREETGVEKTNWKPLCVLTGGSGIVHGTPDLFAVHFFWSTGDEIDTLKTTTDEPIEIHSIEHSADRMPNLKWLIPMAISLSQGTDRAAAFIVNEQYETPECPKVSSGAAN